MTNRKTSRLKKERMSEIKVPYVHQGIIDEQFCDPPLLQESQNITGFRRLTRRGVSGGNSTRISPSEVDPAEPGVRTCAETTSMHLSACRQQTTHLLNGSWDCPRQGGLGPINITQREFGDPTVVQNYRRRYGWWSTPFSPSSSIYLIAL